MSRRGERESPISLFFFQDIITCVSGVMILLMLLFAMSAPDKAISNSTASDSDTPPQDRSREIQQLQERLATLRKIESAYAYARDMGKLKSKTENLEKLSVQREAEVKKVLLEIVGIENAMKERQAQLARSQRTLEELKKIRRVRFIPQKRTGKTPILVECSDKVMLCGVAGRGLEPVEFSIDPLKPFLEHAKRFDVDLHFFVFLLKPSAPQTITGVVRLVQLLGFQVGYDALEESNHVDFDGSG